MFSESVNVLPLPAESRAVCDERLAEPMLYWTVRGNAEIDVDGRPHPLAAGTALWIPGGRRVAVAVGGSDVVVPIPGLGMGACVHPVRVEVPESWRPWLLHAFGEALGYLDPGQTGGLESHGVVQRMLDAAAPLPHGVVAAPLPVSEDLLDFAAAITAAPAVPVSELARRRLAGWSPRTLQRRFLAETGVTPEEWARRQRVMTASALLIEGGDLESVAQTVGFATVSGFSRLFRQLTGMSPGRWRDHAAAGPAVVRPAEASPVDELPPQRTWPRANGSHVAVWVLRGRADLTVGGRELAVPEGGAVVLPAGLPNGIRMSTGSLLLPVGFRSGREGGIGAPIAPAAFSAAEQDDLIQAMVAAYTTVRPRGLAPSAGFDAVHARSTHAAAGVEDTALAAVAAGLAVGAVAEPSLAACARWLGVAERELSRIVNDRAGMTFAQWGRMLRASRARAQLHGGEPASVVSRHVGYAHLPAFSRAFREVHGRSPQGIAVVAGRASEVGRWHRLVAGRITQSIDEPVGGGEPSLPLRARRAG